MPPKSRLIPAVQKILKEYNIRLTIRQVFYRLVATGVVQNKYTLYKSLITLLSRARKKGVIPYSAFIDRARSFVGGENFGYLTPEDVFEDAQSEYESSTETFQDSYVNFDLPEWYEQPKYVEVWLEKDALAGLFQQVTSKRRVRLAPCRGYPSLTFLYEAAQHFRIVPKDKQITILYFGDFDVRGLDIERHITDMLSRLTIANVEVHRCGLTKEQITEHNLPPQPSKKTDTMASGWIETHGDVAWELDALDPNVLMKLIDNSIEEHFDREIYAKRNAAIVDGEAEIKEKIAKYFGEEVI